MTPTHHLRHPETPSKRCRIVWNTPMNFSNSFRHPERQRRISRGLDASVRSFAPLRITNQGDNQQRSEDGASLRAKMGTPKAWGEAPSGASQSNRMHASGRATGFFAALRMTSQVAVLGSFYATILVATGSLPAAEPTPALSALTYSGDQSAIESIDSEINA